MGERSHSATRWECPAPGSRSLPPRSCNETAASWRLRPCALASDRASRSRSNGCNIVVMSAVAEKTLDKAAIMAVLETVPDPEIPVLTITDLGIVRGITENPACVRITPTYTGCPATLVIEQLIRDALDQAGFVDVFVERQLFPPWV